MEQTSHQYVTTSRFPPRCTCMALVWIGFTRRAPDEVISPSSTPAVARQLRGTIAGNKVSLTTEFEARVNLNGEESARKITVVYDLTLNGDKLEGTMTNKGPNGDMPARPFSAWRETSK